MICSRKKLGMALVLAQSAALVPAAYAQMQLEEIIVTAERREASLQDTEISITAFNENTLSELGVTNYLDLADFAPNVMMHEMPGKAGGAIAIRGFKNAETISTFEPKVGLYLDGVIVAKGAGSVFDVMDLERVEILRGPQGTLYGRNSAGGAVNFITKKPEFEAIGGKVAATLGKYGKQDIKGTLNLPLMDNLAMKASLGSLNTDGYFKNRDNHPNDGINVRDKDLGYHDRQVAHVQFLWEPAENLEILYAYDWTDIDEDTYPIALVGSGPSQPLLAQYVTDGSGDREFDFTDSFMTSTVKGHNLTANLELNDNLSLVSITAYRSIDVDNSADSDGSPLTILNNFSGDNIDTFTQELRLVGNAIDERLEFVAGAFYMDESINDFYSSTGLGAFGITAAKDGDAQSDIWAVFGEGTFDFTEKLSLTLGIRYTEEEKSMNRTDSTVLGVTNSGPVLAARVFPEAENDFSNVSGMGSLSYQWTDDVMTYFKIAEGFVAGGFNPRSPTTGLTPQQVQDAWEKGFEEETLINYELGWKTTLLDGRLRLNGAIFYIDYSDLQVNQLTETGQNNIGNAGDATLQGGELEVIAVITDNLEMGGGYGYLDPEYDTYIDSGGNDLSNNHWAHAPENTFNVYARYEIPNFQNFGDLMMRVDYSWVDDHFLLTANPVNGVDKNVAPSYDFVNARIALNNMAGPSGTRVNVSLWGKNLTDEVWYTSGFDLSDGFLGFVGKAVAPPRTFGVDLNVEF